MSVATPNPVTTATIDVTGMSCGHCVANVKKALAGVGGVTDAQVSIGRATVTVGAERSDRILHAARSAIEQAGYGVASTSSSAVPARTTSCCCAPQSISKA
jgi:copper chaperone